MSNELYILVMSAASIAFIHTLVGPDHYLPFVALGKSRGWRIGKVASVTALCGIGHSIGSILLGIFGIWAGSHLPKLEMVEAFRGDLAAWLLMSFGFLYMIWGIKKARNSKQHNHVHMHADGTLHSHTHNHRTDHAHIHTAPANSPSFKALAPWSIFIIFVLGPCEPLIPLLMYPAASMGAIDMGLIVGTFVGVTIITMTSIAVLAYSGVSLLRMDMAEKHVHSIAGGTLAMCGFAIVGLGL